VLKSEYLLVVKQRNLRAEVVAEVVVEKIQANIALLINKNRPI